MINPSLLLSPFLILLLLSCEVKNGVGNGGSSANTELGANTSLVDSLAIGHNQDLKSDSAEKVVSGFFKWYIIEGGKNHPNSLSSIPAIKMLDSSHYILDTAVMFRELRKNSFFSPAFIQNQYQRFKPCAERIANHSWDYPPDMGISSDFKECGILDFDPWIGGQGEQRQTFRTVKSQNIDIHHKKVFVDIYLGEDKIISDEVLVGKYSEGWKIDDIKSY